MLFFDNSMYNAHLRFRCFFILIISTSIKISQYKRVKIFRITKFNLTCFSTCFSTLCFSTVSRPVSRPVSLHCVSRPVSLPSPTSPIFIKFRNYNYFYPSVQVFLGKCFYKSNKAQNYILEMAIFYLSNKYAIIQ